MGIEAAIIGGGAVLGGLISSSGSSSAAKAQSKAAQYAADSNYWASVESSNAILSGAAMSAGAVKEAAAMGAEATMEAARLGADATRYAADQATQTQLKMYGEATAANAPYTAAGKQALATLQQMMKDGPGEFTADPGYQFRLNQGNDNILANAAATGNLASGRTLKALQEYGQDYASHEYQNFINRYYQALQPYQFLTSVGQSAAALQGNNAMAAGSNIANTQMQMGTNLASIYSAQGANLANIYGQQGASLANIYGNMGTNLANNYQSYGNNMAQNYMMQGNISASNAINQANAWTGAINNGLMAYGMYSGYGGFGSGGTTSPYSYYGNAAMSSAPYSQSTLANLPTIF